MNFAWFFFRDNGISTQRRLFHTSSSFDKAPTNWLKYNEVVFPPTQEGESLRPAVSQHFKYYSSTNIASIPCTCILCSMRLIINAKGTVIRGYFSMCCSLNFPGLFTAFHHRSCHLLIMGSLVILLSRKFSTRKPILNTSLTKCSISAEW